MRNQILQHNVTHDKPNILHEKPDILHEKPDIFNFIHQWDIEIFNIS
jgi:hypothetical protein